MQAFDLLIAAFTAINPCFISSKNFKTSHRNVPLTLDGPVEKRCISLHWMRLADRFPTIIRPLSAPKSHATNNLALTVKRRPLLKKKIPQKS